MSGCFYTLTYFKTQKDTKLKKMEKSESIKNIALAMITFQLKVDSIKKDSVNPFFKSKYASLSAIQDAIATPLNEAGLAFMQFPDGEHGLTTIILHESGEWLQSTYKMKPVKDDPQGVGSCITYQKHYALAGALGLNIDDDDDGNTATHGGPTPEKATENNMPWLNEGTKEWTGAVAKMKAGTSSIPALRKYFKIAKSVEAKLIEQSKKPLADMAQQFNESQNINL